jgi:hypothetical protein
MAGVTPFGRVRSLRDYAVVTFWREFSSLLAVAEERTRARDVPAEFPVGNQCKDMVA